jgi:hypothetical protein
MNTPTRYTRLQAILFYTVFAAIFIIAFCLYSPYYNIRFSTDHATQVLMTQHLQLPDDFYYWGQNRLGSLVPILAHGLHKCLHIDALPAITIVHYGFLLGVALLACRYLKTRVYKLLFAGLWLLPLPLYKEHLFLGHPYAPQLFLLFAGMYLHELKITSFAGRALLYFAGTLLILLSCWISELSVCFVASYYFLPGLRFFRNRKTRKTDQRLLLVNGTATIAAFVLTALFITYAKAHATISVADYSTILAPAKTWGMGIVKHGREFCETITHISDAPFKGSYAILFVLILLLLAFQLLRQKLRPVLSPGSDRYHMALFFFTGFGAWLLLYFLHWASRDGYYDYKYWTFPCCFVFLFLLMIAERSAIGSKLTAVAFGLLFLVQLQITRDFATDKTKYRWDSEFCYDELKQYRQLGDCGLIADYWYSYSLASADPVHIAATPHEQIIFHTPRCIRQVLSKKTIYLVKNRWLDNWPDVITQFGHRLVKSGAPFRIERASFCRYAVEQQ